MVHLVPTAIVLMRRPTYDVYLFFRALMMAFAPRRYLFLSFLAFALLTASLFAQEVSVEKVFAAVPYAQWIKKGPQMDVPWKVHTVSYGLSLHQRLVTQVNVELDGAALLKRPADDRVILLIEIIDPSGHPFRDYSLFHTKNLPPKSNKHKIILTWDFFALPGTYQMTLILASAKTSEHNLMQTEIRVDPLKNDPLPQSWAGLPAIEFLAPHLEGPDSLYRPDITEALNLPLATQRAVEVEVLADVTASDLFRGSTRAYNRYLSVALPLLKAFTEIKLQNGILSVAMLDLRHHRVMFSQENVERLDWPRARAVLAPENGPAMVDLNTLEQHRESPAFLQDELLRRLSAPLEVPGHSGNPLRVFLIIGSPMDFYSFRDLPHLPPGSEQNCVVYYFQFQLLNTAYANGAIGNVRNMLKPLPLHVFKVRSPESIRHALAKIMEEVGSM